MTNRTKGWLMLSPLIVLYVSFIIYALGWLMGLSLLLLMPLGTFYLIKALDLISSRNKELNNGRD